MPKIVGYSRQIWDGSCVPGEKGEAEAFAEAKKLVLTHLGISPLSVDDFQVSFLTQTATFTDPSTGQSMEVDLPSIPDPKGVIENYYDSTPLVGGRIRLARKIMQYSEIHAHCKGDQSGFDTLERTTAALKKLPQGISNVPRALAMQRSKEARALVSRRLHFVEHFLEKWKEKIEERKKKKLEELKTPGLPVAVARKLKKELEELQTLSKQLATIDLYALSQALVFYPTDRVDQDTLDQIAKKLERAVLSEIKPRKWRGYKAAPHSEADIAYSRDVAGMLYLDRASYYRYCESTFGESKTEHVTDIILREAIRFAGMDGEYTAEGFKKSVLLQEMSPDLREEIEADLNKLGITASHAIPEPDPSAYEDPKAPDGASEKDKAELLQKKMEEVHQAEAAKVKKDLKFEDIPRPAEPESNPGEEAEASPDPAVGEQAADDRSLAKKAVVSLAKKAVVPLATAGGVLAVGAVAGALGYPVREIADSLFQNRARVVASLSMLAPLPRRVVDWVAPRIRDPKTAIDRRQPKFRRLAMMGGAAIVTALSGMAMWRAVNDGIEDDSLLEQAGEYTGMALQIAALPVDYIAQHGMRAIGLSLMTIQLARNLRLRTLVNMGAIAAVGGFALYKLIYGGGPVELAGKCAIWTSQAGSHLWLHKSSILPIIAIKVAELAGNRLPPVIGAVTKPASRAIDYISGAAIATAVVGKVGSIAINNGRRVIGLGSKYGGAAVRFVAGAARKVEQFAKATFGTYQLFTKSRPPLTIM